MQVGTSTAWESVSAGGYHTCGIKGGKLYCWGANDVAQLGDGTVARRYSPVRIGGSARWESVSAGTFHTCGISAGKLFCWGSNADGQLGVTVVRTTAPSMTWSLTPTRIGSSTTWESVSAGSDHTCGIDAGKLLCWGFGQYVEPGDGSVYRALYEPVQVGESTHWQNVSAADQFTCGIEAGRLFCWAEADPRHAVDGTTGWTAQSPPRRIGASTNWQRVSLQGARLCATQRGRLFCGKAYNDGAVNLTIDFNDAGGPMDLPPTLMKVDGSTSWESVSSGAVSCGIKAGKLYCWGNNDFGQLGDGTSANQDGRVQVGTSANWESVSAGALHICGIDDGKLLCWGSNQFGQLGQTLRL